jgi:hypothetical protein
MNRLVVFVSTYPVIAVVWFVGMSVSIGFSILAGARHRRNVKERLAMRGQHSDGGSSAERRRVRSS